MPATKKKPAKKQSHACKDSCCGECTPKKKAPRKKGGCCGCCK